MILEISLVVLLLVSVIMNTIVVQMFLKHFKDMQIMQKSQDMVEYNYYSEKQNPQEVKEETPVRKDLFDIPESNAAQIVNHVLDKMKVAKK